MTFSSLVPTLIIGYLKNEYLLINDIFLVRKNTQSWSRLKMDWLRNKSTWLIDYINNINNNNNNN